MCFISILLILCLFEYSLTNPNPNPESCSEPEVSSENKIIKKITIHKNEMLVEYKNYAIAKIFDIIETNNVKSYNNIADCFMAEFNSKFGAHWLAIVGPKGFSGKVTSMPNTLISISYEDIQVLLFQKVPQTYLEPKLISNQVGFYDIQYRGTRQSDDPIISSQSTVDQNTKQSIMKTARELMTRKYRGCGASNCYTQLAQQLHSSLALSCDSSDTWFVTVGSQQLFADIYSGHSYYLQFSFNDLSFLVAKFIK